MSGGSRTKTTEPWDIQIPYLKEGFQEAQNLYKAGAPAYYPGPTLAPFDPSQQAAQRSVLGYAMGPRSTGMQMGAEGALGRSLAGATPFNQAQTSDLLAGNVNTGAGTPYGDMMTLFGNQAKNQLLNNVLPGIRSAMVEAHPGGSSVGNNIQAKAIAAANQQMINKAAEMYGNAYAQAQGMRMPAAQMGIQQQQYGMGAYPTIMGAPLGMYGAVQDVGDQRQAMNQAAIDRDIARYSYDAQAPQAALQNYMAMVSPDYGSTTTAPGPSGLDTIGKLASIASIFMPGSDIRIKENIVPEGTTWKGFNVYTYNYKYNPTSHRSRGVMAQEVELTRPDAVVEIDGVKHVNYGVL
tara:strand:- start:230 stop:1282 length:1053 start_codon:yes stop_codon:yes gene_type:complete